MSYLERWSATGQPWFCSRRHAITRLKGKREKAKASGYGPLLGPVEELRARKHSITVGVPALE